MRPAGSSDWLGANGAACTAAAAVALAVERARG